LAEKQFDVLVVGAGPAGSITALVLARGGARVALVDKASFPRDKACGDLVGPRGVQLLHDLNVFVPAGFRASDMLVVGPTGRRVRLPARPGRTYPGYGICVTRSAFDATLQRAAIESGAEFFEGRAEEPISENGRLCGFVLSSSTRLQADVIVGADGATSRVATVAGLVDTARVLWGFAARTYADDDVSLPHIVLWTPERGTAFPGYGWVFPGENGGANFGLGVGVLSDRAAGRRAMRAFDAFRSHAVRLGILAERNRPQCTPLGAWLKLGMVGTTPARDRVLLVGDAAGLVNPLQGEGIAQAMGSGAAAAGAILTDPAGAHTRYRASLARRYAPYLSITAPLHRFLLTRPKLVATVTRGLTAPGVGRALAGGWAVAWNDLLDGAPPSGAMAVAAAAGVIGRGATAGAADRRWIARACAEQGWEHAPELVSDS
jgi:menaquinone-9 beta-reductase